MRNLSNLERRVAMLERPMVGENDPLEFAISNLSDNDLGLLSEYRELHLAGFAVEEIRGMMGSESFEMALDVMKGVDREIARLSVPPVRKMVPRPKIRAAINGKIGGSERRSAGIDYDDC